MGFNGAGKSTLMNILSGLEEPSSGEILIHGKSIGKRREYIGYMLQEADLMLLNDSVREELLWNNKTMTEKNWIFYCTSFTYIIIGMISRLPYQRGSAFASFWEHYFHEETMSFFYWMNRQRDRIKKVLKVSVCSFPMQRSKEKQYFLYA